MEMVHHRLFDTSSLLGRFGCLWGLGIARILRATRVFRFSLSAFSFSGHALVVGGVDLGEDVVHVEDEVVYVLGGSHHVVGKGYGGEVLVECVHFGAEHGTLGTT